MTYPLEFRQHVLSVKSRESLTFEETASRFCIGKMSLVRWSKRIEPCYTRDKPSSKISVQALYEDVQMYPDAYHYERALRFGVSTRGIGVALKRLGVTYKKNSCAPQKGRRETKIVSRADKKL